MTQHSGMGGVSGRPVPPASHRRRSSNGTALTERAGVCRPLLPPGAPREALDILPQAPRSIQRDGIYLSAENETTK
jgi:hypothetical protein